MTNDDNNQHQKNNVQGTFINTVKPFLFIILLWVVYGLCSGAQNSYSSLIYFLILILNTVVISLLMDQDLINERANVKENVKRGDIFYAIMIGRIGPILILAICGLDKRFLWTEFVEDTSIKIIAFTIMILGLVFTDWAVITNRYFSGVIRIQKERGHKAIDKGPYRFVRHPGYLGSIVYNFVTPFVLGSIAGILPSILLIGITISRTKKEDDYLKKELVGYKEYSEKTNFRLIPFLW